MINFLNKKQFVGIRLQMEGKPGVSPFFPFLI
jgi:hypothetical protein